MTRRDHTCIAALFWCAPVVMALCTSASAVDEYRLDDGVAENTYGILGGGPNKSLAWLNRIVVQLGEETITDINIAFGSIPNGTPVTAYLWYDFNQDGDPDDATVMTFASGNVANAGTNAFNTFDIPDTTLTAGDIVYIGAIINYSDPGGTLSPARMDHDGLDAGILYPPNNHSFIAGSTIAAVDPNNLDLAQLPVEFVSVAIGVDGNWLIRANAQSLNPTCSGVCPPAGSGWSLASSVGPAPRWGAAMADDPIRGRAVMFGGSLPGQNETWEWDGSNWTQNFAPPPGERDQHCMAWDGNNNQIMMFGGLLGALPLGETWLFDGATWTVVFPPSAPSPRWGASMAWDATNQHVVLFGGTDDTGIIFDDTWVWDGTDWFLMNPSSVPPLSWGHSMAFDTARGVVVMYGGDLADETWEWDGVDWTLTTYVPNPGLRREAAMAYDELHLTSVLYGGDDFAINNDTWLYDGLNWTSVPDNGPGNREGHVMAYHSASGEVVLFGGTTNGPMNSDTWTYSINPPVTQIYVIHGTASGADWAWGINGPLVDICDLNVPGLPVGDDAFSIATQFANSINVVCPGAVSATSTFLSVDFALLLITVNGGQPFDICVGPAGALPTCCVGAAGICPFNPEILLAVYSGADCDGDGVDDAIQIAVDPNLDANGDGILDSCQPLCPEDIVPPPGVEQQDLNAVLNRWGDPSCLPGGADYPCPEDIAAPAGVEQQDLNAVLNRWGDPSC